MDSRQLIMANVPCISAQKYWIELRITVMKGKLKIQFCVQVLTHEVDKNF